MQFNASLLVTALGLALVVEGIPYFLFAERMPRYLEQLSRQSPGLLRGLGLAAMVLGALVIWIAGK